MESEQDTGRRLRALILVVFALGAVAFAMGPFGVRFFIGLYLVPGAWVFVRPRSGPILLWIMWASTIGPLALVLALGTSAIHDRATWWLMGVATLILFVVIPFVRRMHTSPLVRRGARIPEARIHRS